MNQNDKMIEAILFAVGEPILPEKIAAALDMDADTVKRLCDHRRRMLDEEGSPLQILCLDGAYQMTTREEYTPAIRAVLNERRNVSLSQAALEVLAVVAYHQPVTRAYVEQVRGVDSSSIISSLTEKGLLEEAGRLELPGRPIAYRTTAHFLRTFGLSSLDELPVLEEEEPSAEEDGELRGQMNFSTTLE